MGILGKNKGLIMKCINTKCNQYHALSENNCHDSSYYNENYKNRIIGCEKFVKCLYKEYKKLKKRGKNVKKV